MTNSQPDQPTAEPAPPPPVSDPAGEPPAMMVDTALIVDVVKGSEPPPEHKAVLYLTEPQRQPEQ